MGGAVGQSVAQIPCLPPRERPANIGPMTSAESEPRGNEEVLFEGRPAVIQGLGELLVTILTVGIAALFYWIRSLRRHYRITTERVVIEEGVLSKRIEQTDL